MSLRIQSAPNSGVRLQSRQVTPTNLFASPENFSTSTWKIIGLTVTPNATTAPDGTTTAELITATGQYPYIHQGAGTYVPSFVVTAGEIYTVSAYVKYINQQYCTIVNEAGGIQSMAAFDLINGVRKESSGNCFKYNIIPQGNGWYRISATTLMPTGATGWNPQPIRIGRYDGINYAGSQMYIWGAQLNAGSTALPYRSVSQLNSGFRIREFSTVTLYPLRNTATDPTHLDWRANNPGYTFTPYVGITTPTPMTDASYMFRNNATFNDPDISTWYTSSVTNMQGMFANASAFNRPLNSWNVSNVFDMNFVFSNATSFNHPLNYWDTGNVLHMSGMFANAQSFNQPLNSWNISSVISMDGMFRGAQSFNQPLNSWDTSNVTTMYEMFEGASNFNCGQAAGVAHDLMQRTATTGWQTGNVTTMFQMFQNASAFNGNISNWCVSTISTLPNNFATGANANFTVARQPTWGACPTFFFPLSNTATDPTHPNWRANNPGYTFVPNVGITTATPMTDASYMFQNNATFNDPDISTWDTSSITNMSGMFNYATAFNQPLNSWNVANVNTMTGLFYFANVFNQPLTSWNTGNVTEMSEMFRGTASFNQPIGSWNTANVTSMAIMFNLATAFNQDISTWDTSSVTAMNAMFYEATAFNCGQSAGVAHNLMQRTATTGWQVGNVGNMSYMFNSASAFNGNISNWCVTNTATFGFATGANANFTVARRPTWGACPYPN